METQKYIRFDWAMKRMLRDKANYAVLEGLLTILFKEKITINRLLESESNQEDEFDKYNRVDILAENSKDELSAYYRHLDNTVILKDNIYTSRGEGMLEGRAMGRKEGMREGIKKGRKEGLAEGLKKGREETIKNIVTNLKSSGASVEFISDVTGLTKEDVDELL